MAPYTYYYFFSIILFLSAAFHMSNMVCFRTRGRTLLGQKYDRNTDPYNRLKKLSGTRSIAIVVALLVLLLVNLIVAIRVVAHLHTTDSNFVLVFAPIATVALFGFTLYWTASQFDRHKSGRN
jgi:ABC-type transport system involved in Fe-S cluster assembly fused permease/ATPase subunit